MNASNRSGILVVVFIPLAVSMLFLFAGCVVSNESTCIACKKAMPPTREDLIGVWIGFDEGGLNFSRLDLRGDFTGYFARVSPSDTVLHEFGVEAYRVTFWTVDDWRFIADLSTATTNAEPIYLRGRYRWPSLDLEVGGTNGQWKRKLVLHPESRIDGANQETREKVQELEKH